MAVLAHPDDESLGVGGTLAKYAAEGVATSVVTATRGQRGRYRGHRDPPEHPGAEALGRIREDELRRAALALGVGDVTVLDYMDQELDRADPARIVGEIAHHIRRFRPHVVLTFAPDGAYGHPDHIAVSQFTTAAIVAAAYTGSIAPSADDLPAHAVSALYYMAWTKAVFDAYEQAVNRLGAHVDGIFRAPVPWPDWAVTTKIDTRNEWETVWRAVSCHESQIAGYEGMGRLTPQHHEALWGEQLFYRAFNRVRGGRHVQHDLFEGLR